MRVEREGGVRVGNNRKKREWGVRWMSRKGERENVEWEGGVTVEEWESLEREEYGVGVRERRERELNESGIRREK